MIPFATKNQLQQVEKHLEEKTQTPPNAVASNEEFGYIHELEVTDDFNDDITNLRLFVRLDTAEAVPAFGENTGTKEDTMAFLVEHLINVLYYKFDQIDEETGTTDTRYDSISIKLNNDIGGIGAYASHGIIFSGELYYIEGVTDLTE